MDSECRSGGQACQEGQSSLKDKEVRGSHLCLVAPVRDKPPSEPGVIVHLWNSSTWDVEAVGSRVQLCSELKVSLGYKSLAQQTNRLPSLCPSQVSWYPQRNSILQQLGTAIALAISSQLS